MKFLPKIILSLLSITTNTSYATHSCNGFICSVNFQPNEIIENFKCPGPDFPHENYVSLNFGSPRGIYFAPPFFGGNFYQSIKFDVDFQPPEKLELKAFDQYECAEFQNKYSDLFSFILESDRHFRLPDPSGYIDRLAVLGNKVNSVKVVNNKYNSETKICMLETNYKNTRFSETYAASEGESNFKVRFFNINEKLIYADSYPKILEMFSSTNANLTVTGIR